MFLAALNIEDMIERAHKVAVHSPTSRCVN